MDIITEWKDYHLTDLQGSRVMGPHNRSQSEASEIPGEKFGLASDDMQVFYLTKWDRRCHSPSGWISPVMEYNNRHYPGDNITKGPNESVPIDQ